MLVVNLPINTGPITTTLYTLYQDLKEIKVGVYLDRVQQFEVQDLVVNIFQKNIPCTPFIIKEYTEGILVNTYNECIIIGTNAWTVIPYWENQLYFPYDAETVYMNMMHKQYKTEFTIPYTSITPAP